MTVWRPSPTRNYLLLGEWRVACRRSASLASATGTVRLHYIGWNSIPSWEGQEVVPPKDDYHRLYLEVHEGVLLGYHWQVKVHSQLSHHYWWSGMHKDIDTWCRACLKCATRNVGKTIQPRLTPIPVGGPFDRVGVDVLQLPETKQGNKLVLVFVDYLTKWPEVYAMPDQTAPTIARLFVEQVISQHGVFSHATALWQKTFLLVEAPVECVWVPGSGEDKH